MYCVPLYCILYAIVIVGLQYTVVRCIHMLCYIVEYSFYLVTAYLIITYLTLAYLHLSYLNLPYLMPYYAMLLCQNLTPGCARPAGVG